MNISITLNAFPSLLPSQAKTYAHLKAAVAATPYVVFSGPAGLGRTTILRHLASEIGAAFIDVDRIAEGLYGLKPEAFSEGLYTLIETALDEQGAVICDDFFSVVAMGAHLGSWIRDLRTSLPKALRTLAVDSGRLLVVGGGLVNEDSPSAQYGEAVVLIEGESLTMQDYATFFEHSWSGTILEIDFGVIYRAAPALDLYQLEFVAGLLRDRPRLTTLDILNCLEVDILSSNIRLNEVEALSFDSLPGSELIAEALGSHIVLPFKNRELAEKLGVRPRRGVLLYGPPGTGKTSIGRALAHQMKGRFFLIDGTFITEPPSQFFSRIDAVVREAKLNAPSVLFIDDADVLFQIEHIAGLSRYLLSLLDGLESETANNVCVVMTAMDAQKVPEALLRSGRIELWLETTLPNQATRAQIIKRWLAEDVGELGEVDYTLIARASEGFTPADLRRLAGDARLLYAADLVAERSSRTINDYLLTAIADLVATRAIMAERLADDALRIRAYA